MIYTPRIQRAITMSILAHEVEQKQKRKGKDISYITHPLTVGMVLARAGAHEDIVIAGILHDVLEDRVADSSIGDIDIANQFGKQVLDLVQSVTEEDKDSSWHTRKKLALEHIAAFEPASVLLKSADTLANVNEIYSDYIDQGEIVFERFHAGKQDVLANYQRVVKTLIGKDPFNPLRHDLEMTISLFERMGLVV